MKKNIIIAVIIVLSFVCFIRWYNRPDNGIHAVGKNAVLIEGECITINWNASEYEVEQVLRKWMELKSR